MGFDNMPPYGDNTGSTGNTANESWKSSANQNTPGSSTGSSSMSSGSGSMGSGSSAGSTSGSSTYSGSGTGMTTAMFRDRSSAERAYDALHSRGYSKDDVNLLMSDDTRKRHFGDNTPDTDLGDKAMEGAGVGSAIGGTVGAVIAAIAAIGTSVALPGLGLVIAGPLAASLVGAGAGGLTGGLVGALVGSGIPEDRAADYERGIKEGGIVMGVKHRSDEDAKYFEEEFRRHNGEYVHR